MPGGWILRLGAFVNTFVSTYCEAEVFSDYSIRLWKSRMGKNTQKSSIWGPLPGRLVKAENVFLSPAQPCPAHHKAWMCTVFWVPRSAQCNWHTPNRASSGTDWDCHEGKPCLSSDLTPLAGLQDLARRTSSCPWQAGGGLSFDFCIRPSARQSLGDKSRKEETWKVPKACPCSSPTHRNSVHPSLPTLEALGGSSPAVAICLCYSLMDFPSHHGALRGEITKGRYFLFFVSEHVPTPQSLVLSTLSIFWCSALFWHQLMPLTLMCNSVTGICSHEGYLPHEKSWDFDNHFYFKIGFKIWGLAVESILKESKFYSSSLPLIKISKFVTLN